MAVESRGPGGAGGAAGATATGEPHVAPRAEREVATTAAPQTGWRPADPGPLGLAAFALTTFVLSMYNSGLVGKTSISVVLGLALFYGGATQLLAGMWEFRTGNTFGAVAFSSFGAFWLSFWALNQFYAPKIANATALGHGVGLYLLAWGLFTTYMFVASLRTTAAIAAVFAVLAITYVLLGIGEAGTHPNIVKAGGYAGIVTAALAWYASFAAVTNSTFGRTILPVVPLRREPTIGGRQN